MESAAEENDERAIKLNELEDKNLRLEEDNNLLKGIVQVQDRKIATLQKQVTELKARGMTNNIVVSGITGDEEGEDCKEKIETFVKSKLKKEIEASDVKVAHRLGQRKTGAKPRPIVARCSPDLRHSIFKFTKNLKGQKNELNDNYFVNPQLPEEMSAVRREINYEIKKIKNKNLGQATADQVPYYVKNQKLYVKDVLHKNPVDPPTATDALSLSKKEVDRLLDIEVHEVDIVEEKGSAFYGYAAKVNTKSQVRDLYMKIKLWHPESDHIVMVSQVEGTCFRCDDGEFGESLRLRKWLENRGTQKVAIFITREYGLTQLGPRRHHIYKSIATSALIKTEETK